MSQLIQGDLYEVKNVKHERRSVIAIFFLNISILNQVNVEHNLTCMVVSNTMH